MKKKMILSIAALSIAGLITGCGGGGGSSSSNETTASTTTETQTSAKSVKVVDGYVIGANVCDANNVCATTDNNGTAIAKFADTVLTSKGGYIDVNGNNQIDDNDIALPDNFTLKTVAGKSVISPITDLIANGANPAKLAEILGIDENELYNDPIASNNIELAKAIQIVYALKAEAKESVLIEKINNFKFTNSSLPNFSQDATPVEKQEEVNVPKTNALPDFSKVSALPNFAADTTPVENTNTQQNSITTTANGSLELFANIAMSIASDEAKTLITAVLNTTATDPLSLEKSIVNLKKELIKTQEEAQTEKNTQTEMTNNAIESTNSEDNGVENTTQENTTQENTTQENTTQENTQTSTSTSSGALPNFAAGE